MIQSFLSCTGRLLRDAFGDETAGDYNREPGCAMIVR